MLYEVLHGAFLHDIKFLYIEMPSVSVRIFTLLVRMLIEFGENADVDELKVYVRKGVLRSTRYDYSAMPRLKLLAGVHLLLQHYRCVEVTAGKQYVNARVVDDELVGMDVD